MDRYIMTSSTITSVNDNERMDSTHPRADGPRRWRVFTVSEKLAHLKAYEQACERGDSGAYLRREGLYSSLICEWRKQRDAGVLAGKRPDRERSDPNGAAAAETVRQRRYPSPAVRVALRELAWPEPATARRARLAR